MNAIAWTVSIARSARAVRIWGPKAELVATPVDTSVATTVVRPATAPRELTRSQAHRRGVLLLASGVLCGLAAFGLVASLGSGTPAALWEGGALVGPGALSNAPRGAEAGASRQSLVLRSDNRGQVLFGRYCDSCHPGGLESGGATLRSAQFKRQFNTPDKVAAVVRKGGFEMPAYSSSFLSDADLADIAAYVVSLPEAK